MDEFLIGAKIGARVDLFSIVVVIFTQLNSRLHILVYFRDRVNSSCKLVIVYLQHCGAISGMDLNGSMGVRMG